MNARHAFHQGLVLTGTLVVLWLGLSGHYTGLLLSVGALSVALCVWLGVRMGVMDEEMHPAQFHFLPCVLYAAWLTREVVMSALDVARRVLDPALPIQPRVVRLPLAQRTDAGRAVYANSITLTPGTISAAVSERKHEILVHSLTEEGAEALEEGSMDRRVSVFEGGAT